jgi:hypothetical protein
MADFSGDASTEVLDPGLVMEVQGLFFIFRESTLNAVSTGERNSNYLSLTERAEDITSMYRLARATVM